MFTSVEEQIAVVEAYIHHRTGKQIRVSTFNLDLIKLNTAYNYASKWFKEYDGQIVILMNG